MSKTSGDTLPPCLLQVVTSLWTSLTRPLWGNYSDRPTNTVRWLVATLHKEHCIGCTSPGTLDTKKFTLNTAHFTEIQNQSFSTKDLESVKTYIAQCCNLCPYQQFSTQSVQNTATNSVLKINLPKFVCTSASIWFMQVQKNVRGLYLDLGPIERRIKVKVDPSLETPEYLSHFLFSRFSTVHWPATHTGNPLPTARKWKIGKKLNVIK